MSDVHDAITYADPQNFALAVNAKPFNQFFYRTDHPLDDVLGGGYFDTIIDSSPRRGDRIEVLASYGRLLPEYASLVVKDVTVTSSIKHIVVMLLSCNK